MAANQNKTDLCNRALMILNAGRSETAKLLLEGITDEEFVDYTTVSGASEPQTQLFCFLYERILKQVLEDIQPQFACRYADLGTALAIDQEWGGWDYLFELPSDFLCLAAMVDEGNPNRYADMDRDPEVLHFVEYNHVVEGTDGNPYYCTADHTAAAANKPITGASYASYWTAMTDTTWPSATWISGTAYKASRTGKMLGTNVLNNDDGDSAYIRYVAYDQYVSSADVGRNDDPSYYPENFSNAFCTRLAAEMALDSKDYERRRRLLEEYEALAKPHYWKAQNQHRAKRRRLSAFESRTMGLLSKGVRRV